MIDINFIRKNPEVVTKGAIDKGIALDVNRILTLDDEYRNLQAKVQGLREQRNIAAKERNVEKGRELKAELEAEESKLKSVEEERNKLLLEIPNLPKPDVKLGENESENEIITKVGDLPKFDFTPRDHLEIGELLDIIDVKRAAKVSGTRFYYLKNEAILLEFALKQLAFETLIKEGFIPVLPPVMVKEEIMRALGYMEQGGEEDMYKLEKDGLVLVGTAEHSIVSMHKDEILDVKDLPKRYVGFSTSFRREAGSYGKDTRGIMRAHQFDKVEMVSFVKQGEDDKEHEYMLSLEQRFLEMLKLPYQISKMCTGDLGFPVARKYDIEVWIPSEDKYRELTSTSTTGDFQARRLNIKYREEQDSKYVNILNGTAFSTRPIVAILENYQEEDGSVLVPQVLRKYTGFDKISPKK
ncbi:serine--tRNA ligase [Candidatus Parcubacteria bacterium]|nr:MAG: serine--tRNA ligase [Candidatus Parcubacteria bacterium]